MLVVSIVTSGSLMTCFFRNLEGASTHAGRVIVTHKVTALTLLKDALF